MYGSVSHLRACSWPALIGVWALFVSPSWQDTVYSTNGTIAVHSIAPCHLYGDGDLYGRGVRWSFYMQFISGTLAVIFSLKDELRMLRVGFNIVILAVLVAMIVSTTRGSLAALEWYIVSSLVLILPFYVSWPIRLRVIEYNEWRKFWIYDRFTAEVKLPTWKELWKDSFRDLFSKAVWSDAPQSSAFFEPGSREDYADDYLSMGALLLLYTGYLATQPWLYFMRAYQGHKPDCNVRIYVVYRHVDLRGSRWVNLMKVGSVVAIIAAMWTICFSALYLLRGIDRWSDQLRKTTAHEQSPDSERGRKEEPGVIPDVLPDAVFEAYRRRRKFYYDHAGSFKVYYAFVWTIMHIAVAIPAFVGASVIKFVETTVSENNIDLSASPLSSTGQLLPLIVGATTSFYVLCGLVVKAKARWDVKHPDLVRNFNDVIAALQEIFVRTSKAIANEVHQWYRRSKEELKRTWRLTRTKTREMVVKTKTKAREIWERTKLSFRSTKERFKSRVEDAWRRTKLKTTITTMRLKAGLSRYREHVVLNLKTMAENISESIARHSRTAFRNIVGFCTPRQRSSSPGRITGLVRRSPPPLPAPYQEASHIHPAASASESSIAHLRP